MCDYLVGGIECMLLLRIKPTCQMFEEYLHVVHVMEGNVKVHHAQHLAFLEQVLKLYTVLRRPDSERIQVDLHHRDEVRQVLLVTVEFLKE